MRNYRFITLFSYSSPLYPNSKVSVIFAELFYSVILYIQTCFIILDESYANVSKLKTLPQKVDALFEASKKGINYSNQIMDFLNRALIFQIDNIIFFEYLIDIIFCG